MAEAADFQGTSASGARRWLRRTGAALAGAPLVAGLLLQFPSPATAQDAGARVPASAAQTAQTVQKTEPTGSRTVDVDLTSLTPAAPTEHDTLTLSGTVTNESKHTLTDTSLALLVGPVLGGRSAIDSVFKNPAFGTVAEGSAVDDYTKTFKRLPPGAPQPFTLSVPVKKLDLGPDGVYQLSVTLTGQSAAEPWQHVLGVERTALPWQSEPAESKTKTTYLWPLVSATHITAETGSDEQQTPVFHDDVLAEEISPGGRLQQLLALGSDLDVTWVIDPDLLASVDAMTKSYRIEHPDGSIVAGKNQAVARQWLNDLEKAVAGAKVVALPFGDPDLASLAHTGKNVSGSLGHLQDATEVAVNTVETVLHVTPDTGFAWPVEGAVDPSIIDVATSAGAHAVIARSDSLRESGRLPYTPTAARPIGGGTTAVVTDARLSTAFRGDMTRAETATRAVQAFLAQSLMIRQQAPDTQRSIVVAPQRMPTASQAQTMAKAVRALEDGGWSQSQDLSAATAAKPDPGAATRVPSVHSYPAALRRQEMPREAFETIGETARTLGSFKGILTFSARVVTPFGRAIDREMSTSWRGHGTDAGVFRDGVNSYLGELTSGVRLIDKSETKLSGRSATIPVTVQNNLVQGVEHLTLRLTSTKPTRLNIGDGPYEEKPVKVSGGHSQSVKFTTNANANGQVPVTAQLYTEDGQPYGEAVMFTVDVTEVTATVMLVIAGGVLLLVLAGFRMYTQRKHAAAQQAGTAGPGEDAGPAEDGSDGAQTPGAQSDASDTGTEAADAETGAPDAQTDTPDASADGMDTAALDPTALDPSVHDSKGPQESPAESLDTGPSGRKSGASGPGQPSDPAPDTAPGNTGPSATGERVDR